MGYSPDNKYYFFWSGAFSQWHPCQFTLDKKTFNCAEQYMMYCKALLFRDVESADKILLANDPKIQKAMGREIKDYNDLVWIEERETVVYNGSYAKFTQNPKLLRKLQATAPALIAESSPVDNIWGIGMHKDNPEINNPKNWQGQNLLGKILTQLRDDLAHSLEYQ